MRSAEFQLEPLEFPEDAPSSREQNDPRAALKRQVSERLAAHRSRRGHTGETNLVPIAEPKPAKPRVNRIAAAVAERYAQSQSYRDFLAAEAARAVEEANARAEIAARNAQAMAVAQQQLLAELEHWNDVPEEVGPSPAHERSRPAPAPVVASSVAVETRSTAPSPEPVVATIATGLTVRLYEDVGLRQPERTTVRPAPSHDASEEQDEEEGYVLDDEIAFRQTPVFEEPAGPPIPIPANLIEFPRQLVAPRKARPRLAEGPLREEADAAPASAQLRIFEVEASQIATSPNPGIEATLPEWSSIHLDAAPVEAAVEQEELHALLPLQTAPLSQRLMAAAVDACLLGAAFLAAITAFALRASVLPAAPVAATAAAGTLLVLFVLYHMLFFTFSESTPGMRYARIGLCTFSDDNPTRSQMRRRTWAVLLSACPLGIGFLWAWLDDDHLGWHDRISRMYQRSY